MGVNGLRLVEVVVRQLNVEGEGEEGAGSSLRRPHHRLQLPQEDVHFGRSIAPAGADVEGKDLQHEGGHLAEEVLPEGARIEVGRLALAEALGVVVEEGELGKVLQQGGQVAEGGRLKGAEVPPDEGPLVVGAVVLVAAQLRLVQSAPGKEGHHVGEAIVGHLVQPLQVEGVAQPFLQQASRPGQVAEVVEAAQ